MKSLLTISSFLLVTLSIAQNSITVLDSDTTHIDDLMYIQIVELSGVFDTTSVLEIEHFNILEGDTINSFVELIDFTDIDPDSFLTFSHDESTNYLQFSIGEFEQSTNYTKLIYRRTGQAPEEYILQ